MDKYCVGHGVEYGGSFCPACDLQVKLDEMTRFEAAKESDLQVECGETERLKAELDEMTRIDAKLFNDLRAERDQMETEVERLRELVLNGTLGDWEEEEKRIRALRGEREKNDPYDPSGFRESELRGKGEK